MMNILGIGIVFTRGRGIDCFEAALQQGWQKPAEIVLPRSGGLKIPVYQVDLEAVKDKALWKRMRRSDKFSKMAVLAAADALADSRIERMDKARLGVIVATAFGPHVTTFNFLDDILDYGDASVSPTTFSNSVHNAAASYVAETLSICGPNLTVTQFHFSFQYALQLAQLWLDENRCDYVLVGAVDQYGDVLGYICNQKLTLAPDGRIKPFNFKPTCAVPGEGAAFFLLGKQITENTFCAIDTIRFGVSGRIPETNLNIIDANGMLTDESAYTSFLSPDIPVAAYSPIFGSLMTGSAFNCAAGALMLKKKIYFPSPVTCNPNNINLLNDACGSDIELISCISYNCFSKSVAIYLQRKLIT